MDDSAGTKSANSKKKLSVLLFAAPSPTSVESKTAKLPCCCLHWLRRLKFHATGLDESLSLISTSQVFAEVSALGFSN